jgi:hypothetical protein
MRILIRMCANLMPFVLPSGAFAADYKITVTVQSGAVSYMHSENAGGNPHGNKGHQLVHKDDTISWECNGDCKKVAVTFKGSSPCSKSPNPCGVTSNAVVGVFPYGIAAFDKDGNIIAVDDPDVIVDNSGMRPEGNREKAPLKKK